MTLRAVTTITSTSLIALCLARPARACQCVDITPEAAAAQAAAVFEGQAISIEESGDLLRITFNVVRTWKAANAETVVVATHAMESACGYGFEVRHSYLVYAIERDGRLTTGLCERTRRVEEADLDLQYLGAGVTPVDVTRPLDPPPPPGIRPEPADRAGCAGCALPTTRSDASVSVMIVAGLLAFARARRGFRRGKCP